MGMLRTDCKARLSISSKRVGGGWREEKGMGRGGVEEISGELHALYDPTTDLQFGEGVAAQSAVLRNFQESHTLL